MSTDLFSSQSTGHHRYLLSFKAGRCFRDTNGSKWVHPEARKGLFFVEKQEDDLLHFCWKDRETQEVLDDFIVFTEDAVFEKVTQSPDRIYALRFTSSGDVHFFWMQYKDQSKDSRRVNDVNAVIDNPDALDPQDIHENESDEEDPEEPLLRSTSAPSREGQQQALDHLQSMIRDAGQNEEEATDALSLEDVLTVDTIRPMLSDPQTRQALFPHLPEGSSSPSEQEIVEVISSAPFKRSLRSLSVALNSGQLGPLASSLGLGSGAGSSVRAFLQAISDRARRSTGNQGGQASQDRMDMD
ncbi:proteasome complex subunit Rpn13 ubiquitin receptor-domain-containing protein [Piptocephalis cylindrospora]|uniref:Proteasome complex subunit Rpn13 ubiquitin receptor-domain-containing protein n=1 Tax=Piptocephalis cylindrospora TaxID=1907219 RepID=A0A4P9Y0B6_9FUNG|nr:proteasome complex subunit Rpn13 ubiquitin receptor-domain-containing protein [Piptocephalis cylindrospora]|eukprot:RKP12185.1 proteasome complex subunit Rpn13 ubiquitin receptor-domain-containing protein [Piptocephalis cylindrospora]